MGLSVNNMQKIRQAVVKISRRGGGGGGGGNLVEVWESASKNIGQTLAGKFCIKQ